MFIRWGQFLGHGVAADVYTELCSVLVSCTCCWKNCNRQYQGTKSAGAVRLDVHTGHKAPKSEVKFPDTKITIIVVCQFRHYALQKRANNSLKTWFILGILILLSFPFFKSCFVKLWHFEEDKNPHDEESILLVFFKRKWIFILLPLKW